MTDRPRTSFKISDLKDKFTRNDSDTEEMSASEQIKIRKKHKRSRKEIESEEDRSDSSNNSKRSGRKSSGNTTSTQQKSTGTSATFYATRKEVINFIKSKNADAEIINFDEEEKFEESDCEDYREQKKHDYCPGCAYSTASSLPKNVNGSDESVEAEKVMKGGIKQIENVISNLYGNLSITEVVESVQQIYIEYVTKPAKKMGKNMPKWSKKSINAHITQHINSPHIIINERVRRIRNDIEMLDHLKFRRSVADPNIIIYDTNIAKIQKDLTRQMVQLMQSDYRKFNWQRGKNSERALYQTMLNFGLKIVNN